MAQPQPSAKDNADMTIDVLAHRSGATSRNIRAYQTRGLLAAPRMVGRVGYYDEHHLSRLLVIGRLQERGFSLAAIGSLLSAWEQRRGLAEVLGMPEVFARFRNEPSERLTREELSQRFPGMLDEAALIDRSIALGLLVPDGDAFRVASPRLLNIGAELAAVGIPASAGLDELAALRSLTDDIAKRFASLVDTHLFAAFRAAGRPPERIPAITQALERIRPLGAQAVQTLFVQSLDNTVTNAIERYMKATATTD